jgi:hypothetical protein
MKSKRRLLHAAVIVVALPATAFAVWQLLFLVHRDPPQVIGVETTSNGQFSRRIVYERSYRVTGWLPDPEGGHWTRINYCHYFLETPNGRQEFTFLPKVLPDSMISADLCKPVQNSSLWVSAGFFHPGAHIEVVVFDPSGVRSQRTLAVSHDWKYNGHYFWYENGNATLRFQSPNGVSEYDVVADKVAP